MESETLPSPAANSSRWMEAMRSGNFAAAWIETDHTEIERRRLEREGRLVRQPHHLLWNGDDFAGRDVLVRCQHGLGDTLQFIRFVPRIREVARSVRVLVAPPLLELLQAQLDLGEIRNGWADFQGIEKAVEIEVMELGYAFRCTPGSLEAGGPYLTAPAPEFPPLSRNGAELQVGVLWAASDWDTRRSLPLPALDLLSAVPGVRFHSLQQGAQAPEWRQSRLGLSPLFQKTTQLTQAAAAMAALDLIITVDGMAAHLAGALGRPVWVLLQHDADWRWMDARTDSPWYPTMRLFRQPRPGAWEPALEEVARALRDEVISRDRPYHSRG